MDSCAKVVIFNSVNRGVDLVLNVSNYDDKFNTSVYTIIERWQSSTDEYTAFLLQNLKEAGYDVSLSNYTELFCY
jgi:hypothetical protein